MNDTEQSAIVAVGLNSVPDFQHLKYGIQNNYDSQNGLSIPFRATTINTTTTTNFPDPFNYKSGIELSEEVKLEVFLNMLFSEEEKLEFLRGLGYVVSAGVVSKGNAIEGTVDCVFFGFMKQKFKNMLLSKNVLKLKL